MGYSGGSLASGWAAALQPDYAPELSRNLLGVALGGFITNVTATVEATDDTIFAGIAANVLVVSQTNIQSSNQSCKMIPINCRYSIKSTITA